MPLKVEKEWTEAWGDKASWETRGINKSRTNSTNTKQTIKLFTLGCKATPLVTRYTPANKSKN